MRILTILFVLMITFSAQAERKLLMSYLTNGSIVSLNVALLSEQLVVQKVVSQTLTTPGGLTSIQAGNNPGQFFIYYNNRLTGNGPIKISRVEVDILGNEITLGPKKVLGDKSSSLLNLSINNGIGSVQLSNNTIGRFQLNQNTVQEFKQMKRVTLAGEPYASSQIRLVTPSGSNEFHGSLFLFQRNNALESNVFFNNVTNGTIEPPKFFRFTGPDQPRNMTLLRGCGRSFFMSSFYRISPQGRAQIGHKRQELDNNDFHSIGQSFMVDQFRDHRNPDISYYKTLALAVHNYDDGSCRIFSVNDRFNNPKNANEFWSSAFRYTETSGVVRTIPSKRVNLPIQNNSSTYGADIEVIDIGSN